MPPRDHLERPFEGFPAYGAVHEVIPNARLRHFMFDFSRVSDEIIKRGLAGLEMHELPDIEDELFFDAPYTYDDIDGNEELEGQVPLVETLAVDFDKGARSRKEVEELYDPRRYYKLFDIDTMGVSVVEMSHSSKAAKAVRSLWESQDFGAVEQEARNEVGRTSPDSTPKFAFNRVEGVGRRMPGIQPQFVRQKLALWPDTTKFLATFDLIENEADIITSAIQRRMKQFLYQWDSTPHLTFAVFRSEICARDIRLITMAANENIRLRGTRNKKGELQNDGELTARLGRLDFRYASERSGKRKRNHR